MIPLQDMIWLFSSGKPTRGVIRMNLFEAVELYRKASEASLGILEIGTCFGGSGALMTAARKDSSIPFVSLDINAKLTSQTEMFFATQDNVHLIKCDSGLWEGKGMSFDLVFIDGDHSFEGLDRDWQMVKKFLAPGAVIVFHDAIREVDRNVARWIEQVGKKELEEGSIIETTWFTKLK